MSALDEQLFEQARAQLEELSAAAKRRREAPRPKSRKQKEAEELRALELREDLEKLEQRPRGPNLEPYERHSGSVFVLEHDLEQHIPDGWGRAFHDNADRLGRRIQFGACAVLLLTLMKWVHGLARRGGTWTLTGVGAQLSPAWLARKLGFDERSVERALNRLDPRAPHRRELAEWKRENARRKAKGLDELPRPKAPTGTSFMRRYGRRKVYAKLVRHRPAHQRTERWLDSTGVLRSWVDLTGVLYVTDEGCRLLRRRRHQERKPGQIPELYRNLADEDLHKRLAPVFKILRVRLSPALQGYAAPNNVHPSVSNFFSGPDDLELESAPKTGPPQGEIVCTSSAQCAGETIPQTSEQASPTTISASSDRTSSDDRRGMGSEGEGAKSLREALSRHSARLDALGVVSIDDLGRRTKR